MRGLKIGFLLLFLFLGISSFAQKKAEEKKTEELEWFTDIMKANEISQKTNKPIFAFFTGSDWCFWCKKLEANVFPKADFIKWAKKNVVLLELDFPRGKQLDPALQQQNNSLQQTFRVAGYPTIWMFYMNQDPTTKQFNINALGQLGYPQGAEPGKEEVKFLKDGNELLEKKPAK